MNELILTDDELRTIYRALLSRMSSLRFATSDSTLSFTARKNLNGQLDSCIEAIDKLEKGKWIK